MEIPQHDIWLYNMVYIIKLYMILGLSCDLVISDSWKKQLRKWGGIHHQIFWFGWESVIPCGCSRGVADWGFWALQARGRHLEHALSWVLLAGVCAAAFLALTTVLMPTETMLLNAMPWSFLLHPGATQTSGLMTTYSRTFCQLELWENDLQLRLAKEQSRQNEQMQDRQPAAGLKGL